MAGLPPLALMVGQYLGYKLEEAAGAVSRETDEQAAARLMGSLFQLK